MIGGLANVTMDEKLDGKECERLSKHISTMKGVFSAQFNEKTKVIYVHYSGLDEVCQEIKQVEGVKSVDPTPTCFG